VPDIYRILYEKVNERFECRVIADAIGHSSLRGWRNAWASMPFARAQSPVARAAHTTWDASRDSSTGCLGPRGIRNEGATHPARAGWLAAGGSPAATAGQEEANEEVVLSMRVDGAATKHENLGED
jgi:hypothetical protein